MKAFIRPKINLLIMMLIVIAFVLIDWLAVPAIVNQKVDPAPEYRTPIRFGFGDLKVLVDSINEDDAPKIILTGDSIIQGGGVGSGRYTIAHYLQKELKRDYSDYHVYNLGISGAAPADSYFVLKALNLSNKDIVIYDLNVGHYGNKDVITFPQITPELSAKTENGKPLYEKLNITKDKLEDRLQLWVTNTWKLYAYREVIIDVFKENYIGGKKEQPEVNLDPWYETDWTKKTVGIGKRGGFDYTNQDPDLEFTKYLIQSATKQEARILIFNTPLNQEMMDKFQMIDRPRYDRNVMLLSQLVEKAGAEFKDYEKLVPSRHFTDSLHPMKEGNKTIAKQLYKDIHDWLAGKEVAS